MTPPTRHALALAATLCIFAAALVLPSRQRAAPAPAPVARSWPMWGGTPQRNLANRHERGIADEWSTLPGKEKNIKWSAQLGSKAFGALAISGGKIFVGTNNNRPRNKDIQGDRGVLMCFRESDGELLWQNVHDKLESGRVNDWPEIGLGSTPVVEGNRLWYVSNRCEVVCATTEGLAAGNVGPYREEKYRSKLDGDIAWKLDMMKELGVFPHNLATCSPLVVGDTLFLITSNGVDEGHINLPAPDAPSFLAVDKHTGKVRWSRKLPGKILHGQWANPAYAVADGRPQVIFPGGDGVVYSFNPKDGELLWKFDCNPKGAVYRLGPTGTRSDFITFPVIWEDKLYIGVGQDPEHKAGVGHLWCIDITKKPANKDRDLSPWSDPKVEVPAAFDPKDPRNKDSGLVWHYGGNRPKDEDGRDYFFGRTISACAVHDGLVYAADFDGFLHCLDARTGKPLWEEDLEYGTWSSPILVDGRVYIGDERGTMHIFKHGRAKVPVRKVRMKGKVRATPVACNGVLYVVTENPCRLWAIQAN
jgi:outer membrane protein assembly factor BamB